jgi:hypothetical protein
LHATALLLGRWCTPSLLDGPCSHPLLDGLCARPLLVLLPGLPILSPGPLALLSDLLLPGLLLVAQLLSRLLR